ncbi:chromate transporter [Paenibacillus qinlingensis]|uniref:chromate transporter n=1 Tax=Paenibacillus qinlingensis TaxID=1837343 RepID=UPI001566865F|nr:chromate transporter [Paenibacillus qinlingensis]NQX58795.1 chromate transporter [Paenibacillus qinlingensis]
MTGNILSKLIRIFWTFLRISPLTFGGGYAMLPAIHREVVYMKRWMSDAEMSELLAISGAAPGGVGVNVSALVGYRLAGIAGAIVAVVGITLPTFLIVLMLSVLYAWLEHYAKMQALMEGIHASIIGLIAAAAYKMAKSSIFDRLTLLIAVGTVVVMLVVQVSPLVLITLGVLVGLIATYLKNKWGMSKPLSHTEPPVSTSADNKTADWYMADGI